MVKTIFSKYSRERDPRFSICTSIMTDGEKKWVEKRPLTDAAKGHIENMGVSYQELKKVYEGSKLYPCPVVIENGVAKFEFIEGRSFQDRLNELAAKDDKKGMLELCKEFIDLVRGGEKAEIFHPTPEFIQVFGNVDLPEGLSAKQYSNVDLIFENLVEDVSGKIAVLDYEWCFPFQVPLEFVVWRSLHYSFEKCGIAELADKVVCPFLGISENWTKVFREMELRFFRNIIAANSPDVPYASYMVKGKICEIEELREFFTISQCHTQVYFDRGNGLNEDDSAHFYHSYGDDYILNIPVKDIFVCRVDPSDVCAVVTIKKCCASGADGVFDLPYKTNGFAVGDAILFDTNDSQILIDDLPQGINEIRVVLNVVQITPDMAENYRRQLYIRKQLEEKDAEKIQLLQEHQTRMQDLVRQCENEKRELTQHYESEKLNLLQEHQTGMQDLVRQCENEKQELTQHYESEKLNLLQEHQTGMQELVQQHQTEKEELEQEIQWFAQEADKSRKEVYGVQQELQKLQLKHEDLYQQLVDAQYAYHVISNAFFWKITRPARMVMDALKTLPNKSTIIQLTLKGWRCLRENGFAYTYRRFKEKLLKQSASVSEVLEELPKESSVECLGPISLETLEWPGEYMVDVIVPVFNGFSYLDQLLDSMEQTDVPYHLILVEDQSSDPRVLPFLQEYTEKHSNVTLLENKTNLGFVCSVNAGLKHSKHDVVIVNTDVVFPEGWLERLMLPIAANKRVASATPFTNSGTICSFPEFCKNNALFWGMDVQQIDDAFAQVISQYPIIPTGVGFCMGMSREALERVGPLDSETFGRGYGEENDWCRRAEEAGFVNVHVENLFVYHQHGASFPSKEKQMLLERNEKALLQKHPDYNHKVALYCEMDPCAAVRKKVGQQLVQKDRRIRTVVLFNHSWGGGATAYLEGRCRQLLQDGNRIVWVEYQPERTIYHIRFQYESESLEQIVAAHNFHLLCAALPERVDEIWVNELVTYPELYEVLKEIASMAKRYGAHLRYLLHDYFSLCPTINLLNMRGRFCQLPDGQRCELCLRNNLHFANIHNAEKETGIAEWRNHWGEFLRQCDEIQVFSNSSKAYLTQVYTGLQETHITVCPHKIGYLPSLKGRKKRTNTLTIAILGVVAENKGLYLVKQMAQDIKRYGLDVHLVIIGEASPAIPPNLCRITGAYQRSMLPRYVLENDVDIVFISSIWPETFSYTTEEAMVMGIPVACFPIGAPAERVQNYKDGLILQEIEAESALQHIMAYAEENFLPFPARERRVLFVAEQRNYASRYRVEHFQEELLFHGIGSDFILEREVRSAEINQYEAVILYRCSNVRSGNYLRRETRRAGIKLFFDIDDLIFDADAVSQCSMPEEEKRNYLIKAERYCVNMRQADGLITSTETLAGCMKQLFPDKPVCVRRNSASLEMETLSICAGQEVVKAKDTTVFLAYFSGSWTHDRDFAIIAEPLRRIFHKYPEVRLKVYGCLHLPSQLEDYRNRIEEYGFSTDWRSLPEKCARAHIHLAPLEDTIFNRCKSENKWTEAALAGRVIVASKLPELSRIVCQGETGVLCETEVEWEEALAYLIEHPKVRERIGQNAQRAALETHLTRNSGKEALDFVIPE